MADKKPYIFISYAHKDKKRVLPVIAELQERGYAVWYDAGIEAGSEWPRIIAERLSGCAMMIAFVSENYVVSDYCQRELTYAQSKKKPILTVFEGIDRSELPLGMDMQLGLEQSITRDDYLTAEEFVNAIVVSSIFRDSGLVEGNTPEAPKPANPRRTRLLALVLAALEFCALPVTVRGLEGMSGDFGSVFLRAFIYILLPQIALMIVGIIIARPIGRGLVDEERTNAAACELLAMFVVGVIAVVLGMERMSGEYNGFVRFVIAFLSVVISDFIKLIPLGYSYMKY